MKNYSLFKIHYKKEIGKKLEQVFKSGVITEGIYSDLFEKKFCDYIGNNNCVLVNSGTSALTLAYRLIGISKGDEVIVTPMTCMATNQPLDIIGAKLKFVDINKSNGNVDINSLKKIISKKTKAISLVHWAGQPFNIKEVKSIANVYKIPIVEDAAHALGATYNKKLIGNHNNYTIFSFQAIKHLTSVDGGVLVCKNQKETIRAKKLRWFGLNRNFKGSKWTQDIKESGYKFHMNNINAVIGLENMKDLPLRIRKHQHNADIYDRSLKNKKIKLLTRDKNSVSAHWIYSILVDNKKKFKKFLKQNYIDCDEVHFRNDKYTVFQKYKKNKLIGMDFFEKHMVNIPVGWWLNKKDLKYIIKIINSY